MTEGCAGAMWIGIKNISTRKREFDSLRHPIGLVLSFTITGCDVLNETIELFPTSSVYRFEPQRDRDVFALGVCRDESMGTNPFRMDNPFVRTTQFR